MRKILLILSLSVFLAGTVSAQTAATRYVEAYKEAAIRTMNQHGVPASIILGIAIHESASGTSRIARYLNNHFGLKGSGGPKPIPSAYKGYENVEDCYKDFVSFLKRRYASLFTNETADYRKWATTMGRGGYAASSTWTSQVLGIIKKYRLYEFDNPIPESIRAVPQKEVKTLETVKPSITYQVRKGDTMGDISRKFNTSVKEIQAKNNLKTSSLSVGQILHL